jgi:hypothetical protein
LRNLILDGALGAGAASHEHKLGAVARHNFVVQSLTVAEKRSHEKHKKSQKHNDKPYIRTTSGFPSLCLFVLFVATAS